MRFSVQLCPNFSNADQPEHLLRYQLVAFDGSVIANNLPRRHAERIANHARADGLTRKEARLFADQYQQRIAVELASFREHADIAEGYSDRLEANRRAFAKFQEARVASMMSHVIEPDSPDPASTLSGTFAISPENAAAFRARMEDLPEPEPGEKIRFHG